MDTHSETSIVAEAKHGTQPVPEAQALTASELRNFVFEASHERPSDSLKLSSSLIESSGNKTGDSGKNINRTASTIETASTYLPHFGIADTNRSEQSKAQTLDKSSTITEVPRVEAVHSKRAGDSVKIDDPELAAPIDANIQKALLKDSDLYPPVHNADGSTTYTVLQAGITDRPGRDNGIDYYSRAVNVTVESNNTSLDDCKYFFNPRETLSKEQFEKLIEKDKDANPDIDFHTHGVFTSALSADKEALMLQLSNGRPTVNLDWTANHVNRDNPEKSLEGYKNDTIAAKRANDNKPFQAAIDETIDEVGAAHTTMIGFSHGGFFDTRYLAHRVADNLPPLQEVILVHPDVPISAPELQVNDKPELLRDAAKQAYVIGGTADLEMKLAVEASKLLPGTPTYENGKTEERLGDDSKLTRSLIESEGAMPISERDRDHNDLSTQHFLNDAGIRLLLNEVGNVSVDATQSAFNKATDIGRSKT